jgi:hypothetical protein
VFAVPFVSILRQTRVHRVLQFVQSPANGARDVTHTLLGLEIPFALVDVSGHLGDAAVCPCESVVVCVLDGGELEQFTQQHAVARNALDRHNQQALQPETPVKTLRTT